MEEKPITVKQHYVPQFYLRQWCDENGGFYPIKILDKKPIEFKVFDRKSSPSRFCFENFFYAQYTGVKDEISQEIEKGFAEAEAIFSNELPRLEKKILNNEQITDQDKFNLSECALFLHFRGKKYREESQAVTEQAFKHINQMMMPYIDKNPEMKAKMEEFGLTKEQMVEFANKGEYHADFGNMHHLKIMNDMKGFCNLLTAKYWKIYISRNADFITTDTPFQDIALSKEFYSNDFLSREQTFILSPRVMIVIRYPKQESGKKFNRKDITNNKGAVHAINSYNLMRSINFGFHKNRELLNVVERTIKFLDIHYKNDSFV